MVEGLIEKVSYKEMVMAINAMKPGKAAEPTEVCAEMISANREIGIRVMVELFQQALDEWQTCLLVPIFMGREDTRNCNV